MSDTPVAELAVTNQSALKAWWKLDETSGRCFPILCFQHRIVCNGPTYTAGKFGNAITMDGTDDHVRAYGYTGINGTAGRTVCPVV